MINISINYQRRKVPINLNVSGAITSNEVAALAAQELTDNFSTFMQKKHNTTLTSKSKQKYYLSQYCLMKLKLMEKL
jgi:hypothetical protein